MIQTHRTGSQDAVGCSVGKRKIGGGFACSLATLGPFPTMSPSISFANGDCSIASPTMSPKRIQTASHTEMSSGDDLSNVRLHSSQRNPSGSKAPLNGGWPGAKRFAASRNELHTVVEMSNNHGAYSNSRPAWRFCLSTAARMKSP